jgi:hypothetical protein
MFMFVFVALSFGVIAVGAVEAPGLGDQHGLCIGVAESVVG